MLYYFIPLVSFCLCFVLTPGVRGLAIRKGWIAYPRKERWHETPTPIVGGIAIYLSMAVPLFFIADFSTLLPHIGLSLPRRIPGMNAYPALPSMAAAVWIGISLLFILGLLDDFIHIKPHTKLVGQILVASLVSFMGFRLHWFTSLTLDTVVTIFWIVGLTNAFNLIDNMDGLCAGVGLIAAVYFVPLFIETSGNPNIAGIVAMILAGSLGGFLVYNFNPASIFMGDCGSLTIGFTLSMIGLYYADTRALSELSSFAVPIMILMVPVLDTTMVTLIRILSGRKASVGGKDHTSHRLVLMGFSEKGAVMFLYGVGAVSGIAALFVSRSDSLTSPAAIIPLAISILLMGVYLAQIRVYPEKEFSLLRGHAYTPILMKLTYKRQIMFVLLDFCLIAFAYYLSYRLRFDTKSFPSYFNVFLHSLPAVIACKFLAFFTMGIYRGIWQYMSTNDVFVYIKASAAATLLSIVMVTFIYRFEDFLKGIFLVDWLLTTALVLGTRGSFRISADTMKRKTLSGDAVLIYGAGRGGEILIREILNNGKYKVRPVGLIDDDPLKVGKKLLGYPILGPFRDIELFLKKYRVSGMLISFNNRESRNIDAVRTFCREKGLFLRWFFIDIEEVEPGKLRNAAAEMPASLNDPLYESREVFGVRC